MTDYTSPIPRRSMYSSPSNRSFNTLPLPESAFRDTTINEATAFSNAEQQHKQQPYSYTTRSPSRSLSGVGAGSHIDNTYLMSPSKRFSMARRETDQYGLVDSDNEFIGKGYLRERTKKVQILTPLQSSLRIQTDGVSWTTTFVFLTTKL